MSNKSIIIFFVITAIFGIILLTMVLKDQRRPIYIVAIHGILAIASYSLLTYNISMQRLTDTYPMETYAWVFFSFGALGGFYMFFRDKVLKMGIKKWMPFIHGGLGAIGLIILILATIMNK
ncbi:MAG: hypothetical protein K2X86_00580 [Cytophagaceae bacterium]|nr:hypothetical protein [Cytophagaceae bacterium]